MLIADAKASSLGLGSVEGWGFIIFFCVKFPRKAKGRALGDPVAATAHVRFKCSNSMTIHTMTTTTATTMKAASDYQTDIDR